MAAAAAAAPAKRAAKQKEVEVECIRAIRHDHAGVATHCLVKWKGFDESHTGWEPMANMTHCDELLKAAEQRAQDWSWEYYLDTPMDGFQVGWHPYDLTAQASMSAYFKSLCKDTTSMAMTSECVASGKFMYEIDFDRMRQKNIRVKAQTERPIRCLPQ